MYLRSAQINQSVAGGKGGASVGRAAWRRRRRSRARRRSILGRGFNDAGQPYRVPSTEVEDDLPLVPMAGAPERSGARGGGRRKEWSASGAVASPSR